MQGLHRYSAINTTNARKHLRVKHGITVEEDPSKVKKATYERLEGLFHKQGLLASDARKKSQEKVLREVPSQQGDCS
jgi:hypothetical protein